MNLGAPELLIVLLVLGTFVLPIWGIVDAAVRPDSQWRQADQSKVLWIVLQLLLGALGTIIYLVAIRPKLVAVAPQP